MTRRPVLVWRAPQREGKDDESLIAQMPRSLRREVLTQINMRVLRKAPILFTCDKTFVIQLCHVMKRVTFLPNEEIIQQGDVGRELFVLESGRVQSTIEPPEDGVDEDELEDWEVEYRERERISKTVVHVFREPGTPLCTLAFLFGLRQESTLKAIKKTSCLMLQRDEYVSLCTRVYRALVQSGSTSRS